MDLKARLKMMQAAGKTRAGSGAGAPGASRIEPTPPDATATTPIASSGPLPAAVGPIQGFLAQTPDGPAFYVEVRWPREHLQGRMPLAAGLEVPGEVWPRLAARAGSRPEPGLAFGLHEAAFIDTETTGLSTAAGVVAFLIGVGYFTPDAFVVRQYFLRDYPDEPGMLAHLAELLSQFRAVVSFNGRTFDWPLLTTRFTMQRRRLPLAGSPHIDLLPPSRRLWRERLGDCSLGNLEVQVLGMERHGDVAGALIPALFSQYLQTGDAAPLLPVLYHNQQDLVSLAALAGFMGLALHAPFTAAPLGEPLSGDDLLGLGRMLEAQGELSGALRLYEAALTRPLVSRRPALRLLAQLCKHLREHGRAAALWEQLIAEAGDWSLHPYVELAKHHEHRTRDLRLAQQITLRAIEIALRRRQWAGLDARRTPPAATAELELHALQHRLRRLERKLAAGAGAEGQA